MPEMRYREALNMALREELQRDERVILMGEDIGVFGGAFKDASRQLDPDVTSERIGELSPTRQHHARSGGCPSRELHAQLLEQPIPVCIQPGRAGR